MFQVSDNFGFMDNIRVGATVSERVPSPVDLVRFCRQNMESPVSVLGERFYIDKIKLEEVSDLRTEEKVEKMELGEDCLL